MKLELLQNQKSSTLSLKLSNVTLRRTLMLDRNEPQKLKLKLHRSLKLKPKVSSTLSLEGVIQPAMACLFVSSK